jgi:hypothetical protein
MRLETPDYIEPMTIGGFFAKYRLFFVFVLLVIVISGGTWLYLAKVLVPQRDFEIHELKSTATSTVTAESR